MQRSFKSLFVTVVFSFVCLPTLAHAVSVGQQVPAVLAPQNIQFVYSNMNSFYACDYVVNETTAMLQSLGARNVNVQCSGGIPYENFNSVSATFSTVQQVITQKSSFMGTVSDALLTAHNSCDLHLRIYENVIKSFQVYSQQESDTCWDASGDFQAKVTVLK